MSLILLSNTRGNNNISIFEEIVRLLGDEKRIAYIPTSTDPELKYFGETEMFFAKIGTFQLEYFGLFDQEWEDNFIEQISGCDAIYISGGNTYNLLYHIKLRKLEEVIKNFSEKKVVIGTSAGGIVLTPSISISDESNEFGLTSFEGLNLTEFFFYPHFKVGKEYPEELQEFIKQNPKSVIYAVPDKSAMSVVNGKINLIGEVINLQ